MGAIRDLSSNGASGRLQVTTGVTEGAVFFDRGHIVDASLGKLTGFQAINAIAGVRDATVSFDQSSPPPNQNLTPAERMLLNQFFDLRVHLEPEYFAGATGPTDNEPAQVVPLKDVEVGGNSSLGHLQQTTERMPHFENQAIPEPPFVDTDPVISDATLLSRAEPTQASSVNGDDSIPGTVDEVTMIRTDSLRDEHPPAISYQPVSQRRFQPALLVIPLTILLAVVAAALIYRSRERRSPAPAPATATAVQTPSAADVQPVTQNPEASSQDLTGTWKVVNTVEQTSYQPYKNLEVGFELAINQTGNDFTGKGEKVSENGRSLTGKSRTPIEVKGSIDGDKIEATFSERGAARKTNGRFVWRIDKTKGALTGTFVSSAARASGRSAATKGL